MHPSNKFFFTPGIIETWGFFDALILTCTDHTLSKKEKIRFLEEINIFFKQIEPPVEEYGGNFKSNKLLHKILINAINEIKEYTLTLN